MTLEFKTYHGLGCCSVWPALINERFVGFATNLMDEEKPLVMLATDKAREKAKNYDKGDVVFFDIGSSHGQIISGKGDVEMMAFAYDAWEMEKPLAKVVGDWLHSKNDKITSVGNDYIAEGKYKVASYMFKEYGGGYIVQGWNFSHFMDYALMDEWCDKPRVKIPRSIADYGITPEMLLGELAPLLLKGLEEYADGHAVFGSR